MDALSLSQLLPDRPSSSVAGQAAGGDAEQFEADFDAFLTLLTAQLRNQDPLSPLDSTEFVAQLASFSTVEQLVGTNERLDDLNSHTFANGVAGYANWLGNSVVSLDGSFRATGEPVQFFVPSVANSQRVDAEVLDSDGRIVRSFSGAPDEQGMAVWDGLRDNGTAFNGTDAVLKLKFFDDSELIEERVAEVPRQVTGVRGDAGGVLLDLRDGGQLAPEEVGRLFSDK